MYGYSTSNVAGAITDSARLRKSDFREQFVLEDKSITSAHVYEAVWSKQGSYGSRPSVGFSEVVVNRPMCLAQK
jgi:hypothetical protein